MQGPEPFKLRKIAWGGRSPSYSNYGMNLNFGPVANWALWLFVAMSVQENHNPWTNISSSSDWHKLRKIFPRFCLIHKLAWMVDVEQKLFPPLPIRLEWGLDVDTTNSSWAEIYFCQTHTQAWHAILLPSFHSQYLVTLRTEGIPRVTVARLAAFTTSNFPVICSTFITFVPHHIREAEAAPRLIITGHLAAA